MPVFVLGCRRERASPVQAPVDTAYVDGSLRSVYPIPRVGLLRQCEVLVHLSSSVPIARRQQFRSFLSYAYRYTVLRLKVSRFRLARFRIHAVE